MSRELDRAADLKQLRALSPKEREGKGGGWDLEEGDVREGGFELATCVRLGRRLGESFTLCLL